MKYTSLLLAITATFSLSAQANQAVTVYNNTNFNGTSSNIRANTYISSTKVDLGMHDSISSLKVPDGLCAILFKDKGWEGDIRLFSGGYYNLENYDFNDTTSSLHVINSYSCDRGDLTVLYRHSNSSGAKISVPIGFSTRKLNCKKDDKGATCNPYRFEHDFDDEFTSVKVGDNACLIGYKDANHSGQSKQFTNYVNTLSNYSFNDTISSLAIVPASECSNPQS